MFYQKIKMSDQKNGLKISVLPEVFNLLVAKFELTHPSMTRDEIVAMIDNYTEIKIIAYTNLCKESTNVWKEIFDCVEIVFSKVSDANIADFVHTIILWHYKIISVLYELEKETNQTKILNDLCLEISKEMIALVGRIGLYEHIVKYAATIKLPDNPQIGRREQDTEELTFYPHHERDVCHIIIFSKIFFPIFAAMITESRRSSVQKQTFIEGSNKIITSKQKVVDTTMKETYCLAFIEPLFNTYVESTYLKLFNYMMHFVEQSKKSFKSNQCSDVFMNHSLVEIAKKVAANIICKKCVSVSLYFKSNNIMGFLLGAIAKRVIAIEQHKTAYFIRSVMVGDDDEGNESQLEADSVCCDSLFDKEPLMEWIHDYAVDKYIEKYDIDLDKFREYSYWNFQNIPITEGYLSTFLSTVFYEDFRSCQIIHLIDYKRTIDLVTLVQMIAMKKGYYDLAIRITALLKKVDGLPEKNIVDSETIQISLTADDVSRDIKHNLLGCKTRLTTAQSGRPIDKSKTLADEFTLMMKEWAIYFATNKSYINMHPELAAMIGAGIINGNEYNPSKYILAQYCQMLNEPL